MTPEEKQLLNEINNKLNHLIDVYYRTHYIDKEVFSNPVYFKNKISFFKGNPVGQQAEITAPSGGATVDSEARTAIGTIITVLQTLNLTL